MLIEKAIAQCPWFFAVDPFDTAQERGGRRGARNAFANTSTSVLFAVFMVTTPHYTLFSIGLVAAFATAGALGGANIISVCGRNRQILQPICGNGPGTAPIWAGQSMMTGIVRYSRIAWDIVLPERQRRNMP